LKHRGTEEAEELKKQFLEDFTTPPLTPFLRVSKVFCSHSPFAQFAAKIAELRLFIGL
jgi:hypothetical protein